MNQDIESLNMDYAEMAADEQREAKAREWSEALLCDNRPRCRPTRSTPPHRTPCCR